jgi:hypothetical protein
LAAMAGSPRFISFSTSYPELNSAVHRQTDRERFVGKSEVIDGTRGQALMRRVMRIFDGW